MSKPFKKINFRYQIKTSVSRFEPFLPYFAKKRNFRKLRLIRASRRSLKPLFFPAEKSNFFKTSFDRVNPSYFFIGSRYRDYFNVNFHIAHFENKRNQKVAVTDLRFFPFYGSFSSLLSSKHKFFFRRRSVYRFYDRNLRKFRSKASISFRQIFKSTRYHIHLFQTKNNLFFLIKLSSGRLVFSYTNGQTFYRGSKRFTPSAAELAGKNISRLASINKIRSVFLIFHGPLTSIIKAAVRGLSSRLLFSGMKNFYARCHNGIRDRSTRRI
jgi:small subunit ribosomal protein S11